MQAVDAAALTLAHATVDILRMVERDRPDRRCSDPSIRALLDGYNALPPLRR